MVDDARNMLREIEEKLKIPEYNVNLIAKNLESLPDALSSVLKVFEARRKRQVTDQQKREANRKLQEQLARKHDELTQEDREMAAAGQMQEGQQPAPAPMDVVEPDVTETMCLVCQQPLPPVDLSPVGLSESLSPSRATALLQQLLATRQLFVYAGAFDGESATPLLKMLFSIVAYGDNPHSSYQCLVRYYRSMDNPDVLWVPRLADVFAALTTLGYQPPRGHGAIGGQKRITSGESSPSGGNQASGSAGGSGDGGGGVGISPRLFNLQSLLRLLADLTALHMRGRVDLSFGKQDQVAVKGLLTALLRMLLDPGLSAVLHSDVCAVLEGLMQPWDEALWRHICDDAAATASELGPSHRAAYRVISVAHGLSERLKVWQQCAAMQLLRKTLPQGMVGASGGSSSSRGHVGVDIEQVRTLLGKQASVGVKVLLTSLGRSGRHQRGAAAGSAGETDYWRLLTILQCAHLVVWTTVYTAEGDEADDMARWMSSYFKAVEQCLRGQHPTVMRIKVFLADVTANYDLLAGAG